LNSYSHFGNHIQVIGILRIFTCPMVLRCYVYVNTRYSSCCTCFFYHCWSDLW